MFEKIFQKRIELISQFCQRYDFIDELEENGSVIVLSNVKPTEYALSFIGLKVFPIKENQILQATITFNDYNNDLEFTPDNLSINLIEFGLLNVQDNSYHHIGKTHVF